MVTRGEAGLAEEGSQGGRRNGRHSGSLTISAWVARGQINPEPDIPASPGSRALRLDAAGTSRDRSRVCPALPFHPFPPRPPCPPSSARLTPACSALGSEAASSAAHPGVRLVSRARTPRVSPFVRRDMPPGDFLTDPCPQRTACAQHPAPRLTENGRPETAVDRKDEGRRGGPSCTPILCRHRLRCGKAAESATQRPRTGTLAAETWRQGTRFKIVWHRRLPISFATSAVGRAPPPRTGFPEGRRGGWFGSPSGVDAEFLDSPPLIAWAPRINGNGPTRWGIQVSLSLAPAQVSTGEQHGIARWGLARTFGSLLVQ